MKRVKLSTRQGKRLVSIAQNYEGRYLSDIYEHWSTANVNAMEALWTEFCNTPDAVNFRICSHNYQDFTVAWFTPFGCRVITPFNDYFVDFDA